MIKDKKAFGNFLREMIKQTGISQSAFYSAVEITKPYFYDILSGKVNPPPPDIQYKMLENLTVNEKQRKQFLNLAGEGRREILPRCGCGNRRDSPYPQSGRSQRNRPHAVQRHQGSPS